MKIRGNAFRKLLYTGLTLSMMSPAIATAENASATYKITVYNLTTGQPFTPPVFAVHDRSADIFEPLSRRTATTSRWSRRWPAIPMSLTMQSARRRLSPQTIPAVPVLTALQRTRLQRTAGLAFCPWWPC